MLLHVDDDSHRKQGVLVAGHDLRDAGVLPCEDYQRLETLLAWFNIHLRIPCVLASSGSERALSWFKPSATKAIEYMRELAHLLRQHDRHVQLLNTAKPGTIIYEDKWQVVAKPPRGQGGTW